MLDAIIVGAGPAGLSAALILGRCRRRVLVFDSGRPRNAYSHGMQGYLSRDGIPPAEFLNLAREEVKTYDSVSFIDAEVVNAKQIPQGFELELRSGETYQCRKLLLATGVYDHLPKLPGIGPLWGKSVHNCPDCDGWELRDRPIAVYGEGERGYNLALTIKSVWSSDVILFTNGHQDLTQEQRADLEHFTIPVYDEEIDCLEGEDGQLREIVLRDGTRIPREGLFFNTPSFIRSKLLDQLGCPYSEADGVETGKYERTKVPGLYVAGNILREVQLAIVAASQGAEAAFGINTALAKEDREASRSAGFPLSPGASSGAHLNERASFPAP